MGKEEDRQSALKDIIQELHAGKNPQEVKAKFKRHLDNLPVDISFVDHQDRVWYFNQPKDRIFPRTKAVIGGSVQKRHPQKSVHVVNQILDDFRNGRRDMAEFWFQMG
jgi:DUF438 domain-containing protein